MSRQEVNREIEEAFGLVPPFFELVPNSSLELEWKLFSRTHLEEGGTPHDWRRE